MKLQELLKPKVECECKKLREAIEENSDYEEIYKVLKALKIDDDIKKFLMKGLIGKDLTPQKIKYIVSKL